MAATKLPGQPYLHVCLHYDPDTGALKWRERPDAHFTSLKIARSVNSRMAGKRAGCPDKRGHGQIRVGGGNYRTARVIWKWMTGNDPMEIDHINGVTSDDRWVNLRECTHLENTYNRRSSRRAPRILPKGVRRSRARFTSRIVVEGKETHLGTFDTPEEAHAAYCEAAKRLHGEFANFGH